VKSKTSVKKILNKKMIKKNRFKLSKTDKVRRKYSKGEVA